MTDKCLYCFSAPKLYLRDHGEYTHELPEMAIFDDLLAKISPTYSYGIFKQCGYFL